MNVPIQHRINPPVVSKNSERFSDNSVNDHTEKQVNEESRTSFRDLLANSMDRIEQEREARKHGDLSASSKEEFFDQLAEQTKQREATKNELDKDDFLKLFVAQLQHQDPLNPDDGAEMATKLAQFNGLEQMMNMNTTLEKMVMAQTIDRNLQLVNYVGKEVSIEGGRIRIDADQISQSHYELSRHASQARINIRNPHGALVYEQELGAVQAGTHAINWDGRNGKGEKLPDGVYTFSISARDIDGQSIPVETTTLAKITGVDIKSDSSGLHTNFGHIDFDEIRSVGESGFNPLQNAAKASSSKPIEPEPLSTGEPITNPISGRPAYRPGVSSGAFSGNQASVSTGIEGSELANPAKSADSPTNLDLG